MAWVNSTIFTKAWLKRAKRTNNESVDDGDKFISLWIAFNGWMKGEFGENLNDRELLNKVKKMNDFKQVFTELSESDQGLKKNLESLKKIQITNMREISSPNPAMYNGTFESLIDVLYTIRCNLFHGRKDVNENKKDKDLVGLALRILLPLFESYLKKCKKA